MAELDQFYNKLLRRMGAPASQQNLAFLSGWQPWEGGWTKNRASFNPFNTTRGSQYPSINSVGVRAFPNLETGVDMTAQTLMNGRYKDLVSGLRAGNPYKYDIRGDLSTWVSGSPTGNLGYSNKVLGSKGRAVKPTFKRSSAPNIPQQAKTNRALAGMLINGALQYSQTGRFSINPLELMNATREPIEQASIEQETDRADQSSNPSEYTAPSGSLSLPKKWKGTHVTDGLDWNNGARTAIDIMSKAGTPVVAPFGGTVERWGSAQGGEAMYVRGDDGKMYWLGHIDKRLPVKSRFRAGQPISYIANTNTPHAHWDVDI